MAGGEHREIESKFALVGELPLPRLRGMAEVAAVETAGVVGQLQPTSVDEEGPARR